VIQEQQSLAAELDRFRTESEQTGAEEIRKIGNLEAACQEARSAGVGQAKQLADLERRIVELQAERHKTLERVTSIEASLTDTLSRLHMVDNQVRVFHARSQEQEKEFGASLSLAITRQNTTDTRLEELRHTSLQRVTAIESSQADTSQQVMAIEASLADTSTRLETMDGRIRTQEQKLDLEHQLYLHTVREIQSQVHSQDQRLNWTMMAAVFAMLLGSAAGGILIWDVQKNAKILGAISMEVERLGAAMAQSRIMGHSAGADESAGLPDFSHAGQRNGPEDQRVVGGLPFSGP
jgi:chromosome segregation ATPase